jgi:hypothetical protein
VQFDLLHGIQPRASLVAELGDPWPAVPGAPAYGLTLPLYGRYGGPGHSGPGEPIDSLDNSFRQHDVCYTGGDYSACDLAFRNVDSPLGALATVALNLKGLLTSPIASNIAFLTFWHGLN